MARPAAILRLSAARAHATALTDTGIPSAVIRLMAFTATSASHCWAEPCLAHPWLPLSGEPRMLPLPDPRMLGQIP
jgi:hypothetical protein